MVKHDAFSACHPAVNFLYFLGAVGFCVVLRHPAYLLMSLFAAILYFLTLSGRSGWKRILGMLPLFLLLTLINPLLNGQGRHVIATVFGRRYTWEALVYGGVIAGMLVAALLWFGCYNAVVTGDKFTCLFGNLIPALSMVLVMVFRLVPALTRKASQLAGARAGIGMGTDGKSTRRQRLRHTMQLLSALLSWALEGGVVTGDAMRSRGWGSARRTHFSVYRMTRLDGALLALMTVCVGAVLAASALGGVRAEFLPELCIAPLTGVTAAGLIPYGIYLLIPTALAGKEAILWRISRSKI